MLMRDRIKTQVSVIKVLEMDVANYKKLNDQLVSNWQDAEKRCVLAGKERDAFEKHLSIAEDALAYKESVINDLSMRMHNLDNLIDELFSSVHWLQGRCREESQVLFLCREGKNTLRKQLKYTIISFTLFGVAVLLGYVF